MSRLVSNVSTTDQVVTAAATILAYRGVSLDSNGQATPATSDAPDGVLGISTTAALTGEPLTVVSEGLLETSGGWTAGPLFLQPDGSLLSTPPLTGSQLVVAVAVNSTVLIVRPQLPIFLGG